MKNTFGVVTRGALLMLFVAAMLASIRSLPAWAANGNAVVRTDPPTMGLKPGTQGTVSVWVDNADNVYGVEVHLGFDPRVIEVVDVDAAKPDVQLKPGDWLKSGFVAANRADNVNGTIDFAVSLLNPAQPVSGSGVIATITFKAKSDGTSALKIEKALLATRDGKEIKSDWQSGAIGVSAQGQAPAVNVVPVVESPSNAPANSASLPLTQNPLFGVAVVGILVFLGALVVVGIMVLRKS